MSVPESKKLYLAAAVAGIAVVGALAFFLTRSKPPPPKSPLQAAIEETAETPPEAVPAEPPTTLPVPTPSPAPPPPAPTAQAVPLPGAPSAGELSEKLMVARRIESSDPKRARELLSEVLSADPTNVTALERMSKKMVSDEDLLHARELAERCLSVDKNNAECAALKASVPYEPPSEERLAQARACVNHDSTAVDCGYTFADSALYEGRKDAATLIAMAMHKVNPDAPATKLALGRVQAAHGAYREALPLLQAACDGGDKEGCFRANLLRQEGF